MFVTEFGGEFIPQPGPGLVAHVAIVVARDDERLLARMDAHLTMIEIRAESSDDLAIAVGRFGRRAIRSIGDPGYNSVGIATPTIIHGANRDELE